MDDLKKEKETMKVINYPLKSLLLECSNCRKLICALNYRIEEGGVIETRQYCKPCALQLNK